jgi:hypothetical protein
MVWALPGLSELGRRVWPVIRAAIEAGWGPTRFLETFRGRPIGEIAAFFGIPPWLSEEEMEREFRIRKQTFLRDWRIIAGAAERMYPLRYTQKTKRPSWEYHQPVTFLRPGEVEYRARCLLRCEPCGEEYTPECPPQRWEWVTIRDVVRLSPAEIAWQYYVRYVEPQNRCEGPYGCICEVADCVIYEAFRGIEPWEA